jgi:hypothetical protein
VRESGAIRARRLGYARCSGLQRIDHEHAMSTDTSPSDGDVRHALRTYLWEHPDAADTPLGIAQWWLPEPLQEIPMEQLRVVLADLVASREVRCTVLSDGTELFSRAEGKH